MKTVRIHIHGGTCLPPEFRAELQPIATEERDDNATVRETIASDNHRLCSLNQNQTSSVPHNKLLGRRKQRQKAVRTGFRLNENLQMECLEFSDDPYSVLRLKRCKMMEHTENDEEAIIAIEATAIGPLDVTIRRGDPSDGLPVPFVLGSNFVGVVLKCGPQAKGIEKGTRVTSIINYGGNSRLITLPTKELMVVPKRLDAADIACVVSAYLPSFQALHHGTPRPHRYSQSCLSGKRVLIASGGANGLETQAVTWLAQYAGAAQVFVAVARELFAQITAHHAIPVEADPNAILASMNGLTVDVIIDFDFPKYLHVAQALMDENGRLVCCVPPKFQPFDSRLCCWASMDCWPSIDNVLKQSTLCLVNGATIFNFFDSWRSNPMGMQEDLSFLLELLNSRRLRPHIDRFISLSGIPKAHDDLQHGAVEGCIVCEPWKD